jgi:ubiquinone/menaquinone biosynthesis C-methylase UbiE
MSLQNADLATALYVAWMRLIRFLFWVLYNPLAWAYDWVSKTVSLGHWQAWQRAALPELRGDRVLELAFGTGDTLLDLHASGLRAVGLDLSPHMARIARQKLSHRGVRVPLVRGRAQQLPFADAAFDSVLAVFPAEFIFSPYTLSEVSRILRSGGRAVVVVLAQFQPEGLWRRFLEWLYQITGQRGPLPDMGPALEAVGLEYRMVARAVGRDTVLLAVLEKAVDA